MILPIVIDPFSYDAMRYHWVFQKHIFFAYQSNAAIIAQARFAPIICEKKHRDPYYEKHQYRVLNTEEADSVQKYFIPEAVFDKLIEEKGSRFSAQVFLLKHRYEPLEEIIEQYVQEIEATEKIEAIINWAAHTESVRYVAEKHGIPVITNEYSLRAPNYRTMCYLKMKDLHEATETAERYQNFLKESPRLDFEFLNNEELLALFLDNSVIDYLRLFRATPKYEIGVAGLHPLITTLFAKTTFTDLELVQNVRANYSEKDILFRKHPGEEPYQATYGFKNQDTRKTPIPFILESKRIAAQGSNIIFEAMLWGRPVYSREGSSFIDFCEKDFSNTDNFIVADDSFLDFIMFSFFVPLEKAFDTEYLRWRLTNPSELEIFNYHLEIYLAEKGISPEILKLPKKKRLKALMRKRGL